MESLGIWQELVCCPEVEGQANVGEQGKSGRSYSFISTALHNNSVYIYEHRGSLKVLLNSHARLST